MQLTATRKMKQVESKSLTLFRLVSGANSDPTDDVNPDRT